MSHLDERLRRGHDRAQRARRKLRKAHVVHPALNDRVLDAEEFGDSGLHGRCLWVCGRMETGVNGSDCSRELFDRLQARTLLSLEAFGVSYMRTFLLAVFWFSI